MAGSECVGTDRGIPGGFGIDGPATCGYRVIVGAVQLQLDAAARYAEFVRSGDARCRQRRTRVRLRIDPAEAAADPELTDDRSQTTRSSGGVALDEVSASLTGAPSDVTHERWLDHVHRLVDETQVAVDFRRVVAVAVEPCLLELTREALDAESARSVLGPMIHVRIESETAIHRADQEIAPCFPVIRQSTEPVVPDTSTETHDHAGVAGIVERGRPPLAVAPVRTPVGAAAEPFALEHRLPRAGAHARAAARHETVGPFRIVQRGGAAACRVGEDVVPSSADDAYADRVGRRPSDHDRVIAIAAVQPHFLRLRGLERACVV